MKHVLFVRPNDDQWVAVRSDLEQAGWTVEIESSGKEALEKIRAKSPTVVVLGTELEGMSGWTLCAQLRKDEALASMAIVLTSRDASPKSFEQHALLKTRADEYLAEPFTSDALLALLNPYVVLSQEALVALRSEKAMANQGTLRRNLALMGVFGLLILLIGWFG